MTEKIALSGDDIRDYAIGNGYLEVWRSWRDNMLKQERGVASKFLVLETLPARDVELDVEIAFDVIRDFIIWYNAHVAGD